MLNDIEIALLGRLTLRHRRTVTSTRGGQRRSKHNSRSPEFSDFRPYSVGDDFRAIDWGAFARLEKLMLRLYVAEEEAGLNLILDTSASMSVEGKLDQAKFLASALAFLGLSDMDRVQIGDMAGNYLENLRGAHGWQRVNTFLRSLKIENSALISPERLRFLRPGLTFILSDFLTEEIDSNYLRTATFLRTHRQQPIFWQILSLEEEHPTLTGDLNLVGLESNLSREITVLPHQLQNYLQNLGNLRNSLDVTAKTGAGIFVHTNCSQTLGEIMNEGILAGIIQRG